MGKKFGTGGRQRQQSARHGAARFQGKQQEEKRQKQKPRRGWLSGLMSGESKEHKSSVPTLQEVHATVRDAAARETYSLGGTPLRKIRARRPWWSGRSRFIYPLKLGEFWSQHFGKHALLLRRGPRHPGLPGHASVVTYVGKSVLGVNAETVGGPRSNAAWPRGYSPEHGNPVKAALTRGRTVRLDKLERKAPHLLPRDPFLEAVARLAPAHPPMVSLTWAPSGATAVTQQEIWHEQWVTQLYGARRWVVCRIGTRSPPAPTAPVRTLPKQCRHAWLRRGDMLYVPARSWHWTYPSVGPSGHIVAAVLPMVALDFVVAIGVKDRMSTLGPALGKPLPLWAHKNIEDAATDVSAVCKQLPWEDMKKDAAVCAPGVVKIALQRFSPPSRARPKPLAKRQAAVGDERAQSNAQGASAQEVESTTTNKPKRRPRGRSKRERWHRFIMDVVHYAVIGLIALGVFVIMVWSCCTPDPKKHRYEKLDDKKHD